MLLSFYTLGTLLCPLGDFAYLDHLPEMYAQCAGEDPDMDVADFIFEHMMNLEDVMNHFENETEEHEKPHQPFQQVQLTQQIIAITAPVRFEPVLKQVSLYEKVAYPAYNEQFMPSSYLSEVFHPPSV